MDKTKAQLRAEAVERLKMIHAHIGMSYNELLDALIPGYPRNSQTIQQAIIDLLTDDEPTNGTADETNGTAPDSPLGGKPPKGDATNEPHEGDAAYLLRKLSMDFKADVYKRDECEYIDSLADMVERDYVRREDYDAKCAEYSAMRDRAWGAEAERDEWKAVADALEATKRDWLDGYYLNKLTKAEAERDEYFHYAEQNENLKRILQRVTAERDEWKDRASRVVAVCELERIAAERDEALDIRDKALGDAATFKAERDEWKAKAEQAMESYQDAKADREPCAESYMDTDTEQQNPSSQGADSGEPVNSEGPKVTCPDEQAKSKWPSNDGQVDTREKLEADMREYARLHSSWGRMEYLTIIEWLDRQADITHRETLCHPDERDEQIAELEAERDRLQGVVKAQADSFAKMERRLSELDSGSELNALRASVANLKDTVVRQSAIIENQRGELARFNAEKRGTRRIPKGIKWPRYEDGKLVGINGAEASAITFEKGCYTIHHVGGTPEAERGEYRDVPGPSPEAADTDAIEDDLLRFAKEWLEADGRVEEQRILRYYARKIGGAL